LQSICSMNHLGVSYFHQGRYNDAIQCFKGATSTLKTLSNEQKSESLGEQVVSRCCVSLPVMASPATRSTPPSVEEAHIASGVTSMDRVIYSRPFEMRTMAKHFNDSKEEEHVLVDEQWVVFKLSIVLIFNLAMSYHVLAIVMMMEDSESYPTFTSTDTTNSTPRGLLLKACSLYNLAYFIPENNTYIGIIWPGMLSLFVRATLNNLGQCYASLDNTKNSIQCFELLLRSIMLIQRDHIFQGLCEGNETCNHCPTSCFFERIIFMILNDPGFAPAA
jgi:tetratricopeptide (TPR) repeat protein